MNAELLLLFVIALCCAGVVYAYVLFPAIAAILTRTPRARVPGKVERRHDAP